MAALARAKAHAQLISKAHAQHCVPLPLQLSCTYPFFSLSLACLLCLYCAVHSFELANSCRVLSPNGKKLPCAGQGQELSGKVAVPQLPEVQIHKFGTEKKITLKIHRIPFCGFFKILL